ncbi:MAG: PA14 domain-containing protein [Pirellulales bacterium]
MFRLFIGWKRGSGLARVNWRRWAAVCCAVSAFCPSSLPAQVYVTGPYGPGGTWNLYELRGAGWTSARFANGEDGARHTFLEANALANASRESVTGKNALGHLAAPSTAQENAFLRSQQWQGASWFGWIGLTDDEAFGGGESASSPPNPAHDGKVGLGGLPGDGIGWKWTDGEPFTYTDWANGEPDGKRADEDYVQLSADGWRAARDQPAPFIVEYETQLASDFDPPAPVAQHLPGPAGAEGLWGVRELYVPALGPETDLNVALTRLFQPPAGAIVRDYQTPVLSYADGYPHPVISDSLLTGDRRRFEIVRCGDVVPASAENLQLVAHGTIRIPAGREGTWEFAVNSDDGFELWIDGAKFNGPASRVTSYGSLIDPSTHPLGRSQGTVQLGPGDHDVEVVYFNGPSAAAFGLQAKGPGDKQFALVGDPGRDLVGTIPAVAGGFALTQVQRHAGELANLAAARSLIDAPGPLDQVDAVSVNSVNFGDPYGEERGWFGGNQNLPGPQQPSDAFALEARGVLHVPQDGQFTFGFDSLSGVQLTIDGATFTEVAGVGAISPDGHSIVAEDGVAPALTTAVATLSAGDYPISVLTYKNFGAPAFVELFAAPGAQDDFSPDAFRLLTNKAQSIDLHRPAGLQLVPEPSGFVLASLGGLAATILLGRRGRSSRLSLQTVSRRWSWALFVAGCAAATGGRCASGAEFTPLGSLPGDLRTDVHGISADGNAVVGGTFTDQGRAAHAFLWTKQAGLEDLGALAPGGLSAATAISGDGRVIVGGSSSSRTLPNSTEAFRWTREEGMTPLGDLPEGAFISSATGVSFDGTVIVGAGTTKRGAEAFRWTPENGMQGMGIPDWATLSAAFDVSGDGQRTLGQDHFDVFQGGGNYWSFVAPPSGPFARIENPPGVRSNLGVAISRDGKVVVGASNRIVGDSVLESPFRWSEQTGLVELDNSPNSFARVFDVSADGSRIVGQFSRAGTAVPAIWDPFHGFRDLQAILSQDPAVAAALAGWKLEQATAISDDGKVVAGAGIDPQGHRAGWRAELDPEPPLSLLPGDANLDSVVDLQDFGLLKAHFGRQGFWYQGDFDANAAINLNDFGILKANFAASASPAVPEPRAIVLALNALTLSVLLYSARGRWSTKGDRTG